MPSASDADTIRVLVASDNHVGYNERDARRGEDSWRSFHEVMCLARERDVDMVLLAGDLFHDNKPSRQAMYQVMRSLRMNCYGDKPCELEMLSDASENFCGTFDHVNYEDQDINIAMPVFTIHGNHDDPSGEGHLSALDVLQISGLINYYGRTPESDNIHIKPVLLQKGRTKLALYGLSNVRDERLNRTFRDGKVKFFQPSLQKENWFNLLSVHQNHYGHTGLKDTNHLPEDVLPDFLDLVVWGHEHECKIDPMYNPNTNFHVIQPGSSIATSLVEGEAVPKHVALLTITGKQFQSEAIPLKTVRPFVMKSIILQNEPGMKSLARKDNNRDQINKYLKGVVHNLVDEVKNEWLAAQDDDDDEEIPVPHPLVRLRVEYTALEGGKFEVENPQRFSSWFQEEVANYTDIVQFYRKKTLTRKVKDGTELPNESVLAQLSLDSVKVEKLVREYLTTQSLTILPQNSFGDAVSQFIDKDDKHAMETFVSENLSQQVKNLLYGEDGDDDNVTERMRACRAQREKLFDAGHLKNVRRSKVKPKPESWDSDLEGSWEDQPGALIVSDHEQNPDEESNLGSAPPKAPATRGRARGRGGKAATSSRATASALKAGAAAAKPTAGSAAHSNKRSVDEGDDDDYDMLEDLHDQELSPLPQKDAKSTVKGTKAPSADPIKKPPARAAMSRQTRLNFSQPASQNRPTNGSKLGPQELSDDEISDDDDDAFEPAPRSGKRR